MKSPFTHLIIALVICVASIVGYGVWYATVTAASTTVAELQNQIVVKTETASRIAVARSALAEIFGDEAAVQGYFVPETNIVSFINDLEARGLSQGSSVDVLSVSTGGTPMHPTLELALTVNGTFDAVMRTVGTIEYAPYNLSIPQLSFRQEEKERWHANVKLLVGSVPAKTSTDAL